MIFNAYFILDYYLVLHITDLHFHTSNDPGFTNLLFLNESILKFVPIDSVIVSGDITMGYFTRFISASRLDQWSLYNSIWKTCNVKKKCQWFDIPGNHDFSTDEGKKEIIYATNFTANGSKLPFYLAPLFKSGEDEFCLIGIDETYDPSREGLISSLVEVAYWMNIYGDIPQSVLDSIENTIRRSKYYIFIITEP